MGNLLRALLANNLMYSDCYRRVLSSGELYRLTKSRSYSDLLSWEEQGNFLYLTVNHEEVNRFFISMELTLGCSISSLHRSLANCGFIFAASEEFMYRIIFRHPRLHRFSLLEDWLRC